MILLPNLQILTKRLEEWGEWVREKLFLDVTHRQVVFVIPKMLRIFFKYRRTLLDALCICAVKAVRTYLSAVTGKELAPGIIAVIQTFGERINFHPHLHLLVTEGGTDAEGTFHKVSRFDDSLIAEVFTHEVFSLLLREELINQELVERILSWHHTGFNVHSKVRAKTREETERVGKYMIRPTLSLQRLSLEEQENGLYYLYGKDTRDKESL